MHDVCIRTWGDVHSLRIYLLQYVIRIAHNIASNFNEFCRVYISRILAFRDFCVFIFVDGHVLPLH